jgi:hypothetical protein
MVVRVGRQQASVWRLRSEKAGRRRKRRRRRRRRRGRGRRRRSRLNILRSPPLAEMTWV